VGLRNRVIILAGGLGKRLRPISKGRAKALVKIGKEPFLHYQINYLISQKITNFLFCIGYKAAQIIRFLKNDISRIKYDVSKEKSLLGTAGAIKNARRFLKDKSHFLVLNGDTFCKVNFDAFVGFHRNRRALASIVIRKSQDTSRYGSIKINSEGRILNFSEKTGKKNQHINCGVYCFSYKIFEYFQAFRKMPLSLEHEVFPQLIRQNLRIFGFRLGPKPFIDIGTPESYRLFKKLSLHWNLR